MIISLVVIGFVAGLISAISPCILPVLPVILMSGATSNELETGSRKSLRPLLVIAGLVLSFCAFTLAGSAVLSAIGLPQDFLRDAGLIVLLLLGVGLLIPTLSHLLEAPFSRIRTLVPTGHASALVLGFGLGAVFVPCAGPVLAAITVVGARHRFGVSSIFLTVAFGLGTAVPLLLVAFAGSNIVERSRALREHARALRRVGGIVLITMSLLIWLNVTAPLQRAVPGYTSALQNSFEGTVSARQDLNTLTGETSGSLSRCIGSGGSPQLSECGTAPAIRGISAWLNTPGDKPITLASLRGHVVLVDFWTYSCINCQRSLPHVEAWYARYHRYGLDVIGVHTPEFAFEHVRSNVATAAQQLGVKYPIALDNDYSTWVAYDNDYWPAEYLIDAQGHVRHYDFGEGNYSLTETLIRKLLLSARAHVKLPQRTDVANLTPTEPTTPETYLGYKYNSVLDGSLVQEGIATSFSLPNGLAPDEVGLSGNWTANSEEITANTPGVLALNFQAKDVYLVLGGHGSIQVDAPHLPPKTFEVSGIARLYTLISGSSTRSGILKLKVSPGIMAYDFTFG